MTSHLKAESFDPGQIHRKSFGLKEQIKGQLTKDYYSDIVSKIQAAGNLWTAGDLTFHLASSFGFCYGVDRAVDLAYETHERFPDKKIYLTAQIIHNPRVNNNLQKMGVRFLTDYDEVAKEDVVVLPAFGATASQIRKLKEKGCILVDTICGSVLNVWKRVESYAEEGFTAVIHGKVYHEETQATSSRVLAYPNGKYLVVLNMPEVETVCDYIRRSGDKKIFLQKFAKAVSPGFDPDQDLRRVGVANQTTMLMSESLAIADRLKEAMVKRYGEKHVHDHFRNFDTICSATEDRQNAILNLKKEKLDLMVVIGGYNSSNTNHLAKMASSFVTTYHIEDADCLVSPQAIRHKPFGQFETVMTENWLPSGPLQIGITSGASTPNQVMGEVVEKVLSFRQSL
ncbi:MAG: 4-hydroxy-3-methylbut-2-enyl diphosphate reductase [Deltaproteobacteria bacterium]|nr:4-hydroxy-3-methylbut-2-enyl diphosphate reductase [Deltaproteobacteria bacterium]